MLLFFIIIIRSLLFHWLYFLGLTNTKCSRIQDLPVLWWSAVNERQTNTNDQCFENSLLLSRVFFSQLLHFFHPGYAIVMDVQLSLLCNCHGCAIVMDGLGSKGLRIVSSPKPEHVFNRFITSLSVKFKEFTKSSNLKMPTSASSKYPGRQFQYCFIMLLECTQFIFRNPLNTLNECD